MTPAERASLLERVLDTWTDTDVQEMAKQWEVEVTDLEPRARVQRLILHAEKLNDVDLLYAQLQPGDIASLRRSVSPDERFKLIQAVLKKWPKREDLCDIAFEAGVDATGLGTTPVDTAKKMVLRVENDGQVDWLRQRIGATTELDADLQQTAPPATNPAARAETVSPSPSPFEESASLWTYIDFDVEISPSTETEYEVHVIASSAGQARATTRVTLTSGPISDSIEALRAAQFNIAFAKSLGNQLLQALLTGDVSKAYDRTLGRADSQERGIRLRLRVNAPELKALPWEYLYDAKRDNFLAVRRDVVISRYLEVDQGVRALPQRPSLRILALLSGPTGPAKLDLAGEQKRIEDALAPLVANGRVVVEFETNPTASNIRSRLRRNVYHVIHYSGHAYYAIENKLVLNQAVTKDTGYVVLPHDDGSARLMDEESFAQFFLYPNIRLVILNACQGGQTSLSEYLSGLGDKLVQTAGIPAVIAMQFPIKDEAAKQFAQEFYASLADDLPIDAAVAQARQALYQDRDANYSTWGIPVWTWGAPVLFMRSEDGRLFA
ncbi:MAG: CHAT domain-containing protein [Anaerolineae bacterium]